MESIKLIKTSKNIKNGIERYDLHQKRMRSVDKNKEIIHGLGWIWLEQNVTI